MLTPFSMFVSPRFAMRDRGGVERAEVEVAKEIPSLLVPLFRGKRQEIQIKRADGREYAVQELRREQVEVGRHKGDDTRLTLPLGVSTFFFFLTFVQFVSHDVATREKAGKTLKSSPSLTRAACTRGQRREGRETDAYGPRVKARVPARPNRSRGGSNSAPFCPRDTKRERSSVRFHE